MKTVSLDPGVQAVFEQRGVECNVSLAGRVTIDTSPDLRLLLLQRLESPGCQILTVDFGESAYVDTSGIAILAEILKAARDQGKTFRLCRLGERTRYVLETTRLLHLFEQVNRETPRMNPSLPGTPQ
jgi:anti-anti-sigma factor